jgi:acyl-CoA synthetase (AMP-forming)/AMP-acid ligase II
VAKKSQYFRLEIEDVIMGTELAVETAVIGVQDDILGHRLVALVAPVRKDCTENQILRHCAEKLPKYKIPSKIKLVKSIPKNQIGKIDRTKCMELFKYNK